MGGPNLEVFKFGMYIMFPIGIMYYFGTNLDEKFSVPDFWPKREQTHKLPYDRKEIEEELERLKARRLAARARRIQLEEAEMASHDQQSDSPAPPELHSLTDSRTQDAAGGTAHNSQSWSSWFGR